MKISFIIPAHNESSNLLNLVKEIKNTAENKYIYEIIIVDDNSFDSTAKIADTLSNRYSDVKVIHRNDGQRGIGLSLKEGTEKAIGDFVVWIMGDRCDSLDVIHQIIDNLNSGYDLVIASRYIKGGSRGNLSIHRTVLSRGYSLICKIIFGFKLHDITNGYRGFKREVFNNIKLESDRFSISAEFSIKAYLYRYKLCEVPTVHLGKENKRSIFSTIKLGWEYIRFLKLAFVNIK